MKTLILYLFIALPPQAPAPPPPQSPGLPWLSDYGAAMAERARTGRPLLIDFFTEGCRPCAAMDRVVKDDDVQEVLRRFVLLRVDGEKEKGLRASFARTKPPTLIDGYPTFVLIAPDARGSSFVPVRGEVSTAAFLKAMLDAERWAVSTAVFVKGAAKPRVVTVPGHSHRCPNCGAEWSHPDSSWGNRKAHTCPECGKVLPPPWHPSQTNVPVRVQVGAAAWCPPGKT